MLAQVHQSALLYKYLVFKCRYTQYQHTVEVIINMYLNFSRTDWNRNHLASYWLSSQTPHRTIWGCKEGTTHTKKIHSSGQCLHYVHHQLLLQYYELVIHYWNVSSRYSSDFNQMNSCTRGKASFTSERYSEEFGKFIGLQNWACSRFASDPHLCLDSCIYTPSQWNYHQCDQ